MLTCVEYRVYEGMVQKQMEHKVETLVVVWDLLPVLGGSKGALSKYTCKSGRWLWRLGRINA